MPNQYLPADLESASKRFEDYRALGTVRQFPSELWKLASELSEIYGTSKVASVLRLNATSLKKRSTTQLTREVETRQTTELVRVQPISLDRQAPSNSRGNRVVAELSMPTGYTLKVFSGASEDQLKALISMVEEVS